MCRDYSGKIVAITGFKNEDIKDDQYLMFVKYAKQHNCKIHCLGMTRRKILDQVPFDYTDSSTWVHTAVFGRIEENGERKRLQKAKGQPKRDQIKRSYLAAMEMQKHYYKKWQSK